MRRDSIRTKRSQAAAEGARPELERWASDPSDHDLWHAAEERLRALGSLLSPRGGAVVIGLEVGKTAT